MFTNSHKKNEIYFFKAAKRERNCARDAVTRAVWTVNTTFYNNKNVCTLRARRRNVSLCTEDSDTNLSGHGQMTIIASELFSGRFSAIHARHRNESQMELRNANGHGAKRISAFKRLQRSDRH